MKGLSTLVVVAIVAAFLILIISLKPFWQSASEQTMTIRLDYYLGTTGMDILKYDADLAARYSVYQGCYNTMKNGAGSEYWYDADKDSSPDEQAFKDSINEKMLSYMNAYSTSQRGLLPDYMSAQTTMPQYTSVSSTKTDKGMDVSFTGDGKISLLWNKDKETMNFKENGDVKVSVGIDYMGIFDAAKQMHNNIVNSMKNIKDSLSPCLPESADMSESGPDIDFYNALPDDCKTGISAATAVSPLPVPGKSVRRCGKPRCLCRCGCARTPPPV